MIARWLCDLAAHVRYLLSSQDPCGAMWLDDDETLVEIGWPWQCSRLQGHSGDHVAHGTRGQELARCPRERC